MDFFEIFISGRYHRDMKILKILASNSKRFRVYGIFKHDKFMMIEGGAAKYYILFDNFCLKQPLVLKIPPGYVFRLNKLKNDIKIALKPTAIKL